MQIRSILSVAFLGAALAACGSADQPAARTVVDLEGETCPVGLRGLSVRTSDIEDGGALVIRAPGDGEREIRERLERFAQIHARDQDRDDATLGDRNSRIHESVVRVVDVPGGARLEVRPENPGRARDVREELSEAAELIEDGRCPLVLQVQS